MYVCLCRGITDRDIADAIREGASTVEEVMYCTGAGTGCGSCLSTIAEMVGEAEGEAPSGRRHLAVVRSSSAA